MTITTKYNVGDTLFFLDRDSVRKKKVTHIEVEVTPKYSRSSEEPYSPLITYYFSEVRNGMSVKLHKYESEVSNTKAGMIQLLPEIE